MYYKKLIKALLCDGSGIGQDSNGCVNKKCKYRDSDGACNIVSMCEDAAGAITDLLARAEAAEAANSQLNGTVTTLMESNQKLAEELKAHMETDLAKAHEALCADWAKQKQRAEAAEARAEKEERKRDAAIEQVRGDCEKCDHYKVTWNGCTPDYECPLSDRCLNRDLWEWNGGQKEE